MDKDGLDELIEAEKKKEEAQYDDDDDDAQSSIDIRDFERRLKSTKKRPGDFSSSDDDDDFFDDSASRTSQHSRMSSQSAKSQANANATLMSKNSIMAKVQKIKEQSQLQKSTSSSTTMQPSMSSTQKKNVKKYDDPELEAIMKSSNVDQKVKELLTKYQQLLKSFEREKSLRQKYEQEHVSLSKTAKMDDTSFSSTQSFQSSKMSKGTSVLSAINQNEENLTLKSELQRLQKELSKKDKMVSDLISDKAMGSTGSSGKSSKGLQVMEDSKIKRIETEMKILKKERDEFFASRFDKIYFQKNADLVKDLSNQNSKMRVKIEELEAILKNR